MLYIFHVDTGTMMTFDMNLALESVVQLKEAIERTCRIPTDKQVLLVSGGESLDPAARVCSYSAGTDTNPIYLFSKTTIESTTPPLPSIDSGSDTDLKEQVDGSLTMPATYNTVVVRAQLAQQFCELAREQTRACERLVHDQHLQQQGWSAVVANLEDITVLFRNHAEMFEQSFTQYLGSRAESMVLIQSFTQDLEVLSKIPIIPALLKDHPEHNRAAALQAKEVVEEEQMKEGEVVTREGEGDCTLGRETVTLLQWIAVTDDQSGLEQISDACIQGLNKFDEQMFETLKTEIMTTFEGANKTDYKEIKGLEERLFGLEQLMFQTKQLVQEQSDLAQSFLQNQNRASNLGDPSILPDLCASHRRQLQVMLKNHQQLIGIRRRCSKAKEELCINLYHRLRWIMYVENNMFDLERRLNLYHDGLKRLRRRLEVVQQIHLAPTMYLTAVGEVVRRRTFSQSFLMWASDLACQLLAVHSDEVARRRAFQSQFADHFLNSLFPGLEDVPPPFATEAPPPFDTNLPPLSVAHIDQLRRQIPELVRAQNWPDLAAISQFFLVKVKPDSMEGRLAKTLVGGESGSSPTNFMHNTITNKEQQDSRGFESETDTDEFEKVTASPMDVTFDPKSPSSVTRRQSAAAVIAALEENLGSTRNELDRLHGLLSATSRTACDGTATLRDELSVLRAQAVAQRETFLALYCQLVAALERQRLCWRQTEDEGAVHEREVIQRLTVDHELEMDALKKEIKHCADGKDDEIRRLKCSAMATEKEVNDLRSDMERRLEEEVRERRDVSRSLEAELTETRQHCTQLQLRLEASEVEKQRAVKEVSDRLAHDYKTELENLRSRFRLMATQSMERSPSDSSLEKIDRSEYIELANHEAIVTQLRDDLANERERAVDEAIARMEQELKQARTRTEQEKQVWFNETMRRVVGDKDRQLEALRARESSLVSECRQHQETIQRVTEKSRSLNEAGGTEPMMWPLLDRVEVLEAEKAALEAELADERARRKKTVSESDGSFDMNTSVAVVQENVFRDAATSPDLQGEQAITQKLTRSTTALIQQGKISIMSCNAGDAVLVVWNDTHNNYTILQEMATLYFLHSDCVDGLGLRAPVDGQPRRMYATGEVTDKEYCHAKKPENRYRVPKGTKFYRVKVRPLQKESLMVRSHHHHHHHTTPSGSTHQSGTL